MEPPRILLYIGTFLILLSIFWTVIAECNKHNITEQLIKKGLPTPVHANVFELEKINNLI